MKKIILSILITCLLFNGYIFQVEQVGGGLSTAQNLPAPPTSPLLPFRQVLGSNDEGSHYRDNSAHQEWWYYIAIFNMEDNELKNWSMMVSFNQMGSVDMLFCTIFEENNKSYGGVINRWKGAMKATGPGVNVQFENSSVIGRYPEWHIYAKYKKPKSGQNITVNVTYKANTLPMWLFMNMGHNMSTSRFGHYCIIESDVNGTVEINETTYHVHGVGYHEHSWINDGNPNFTKTSFLTKKSKIKQQETPNWQIVLDVWDWAAIFLDNGWNIFVAKICQQSLLSKILPGSLWISPDGKNITECRYFKVEYLETNRTTIPTIEIPTKIHIKAIFLNTLSRKLLKGLVRLDMYIEIENLHEFTWHSPGLSVGVWEAPCKVYGNIKWFGNCIELNGRAMLELTRSARIKED